MNGNWEHLVDIKWHVSRKKKKRKEQKKGGDIDSNMTVI